MPAPSRPPLGSPSWARFVRRAAWAGLGLLAAGGPSADLVADEPAAAAPASAPAGVQNLFDGTTLAGWEGKPEFWSVRDGAITGQTTPEKPTEGNTFLIWRGGEVGNFELRCRFKIVGGNSGIQYRSKELAGFVVSGYQADIDATGRYIGICYEEKGRGILAERGQKVVVRGDKAKDVVGKTLEDDKAFLATVKSGDWNEFVVTARGNHLVHKVNGVTTCEIIDEDHDKRAESGILALQLHAGDPMTIQFKDLQLTRLDD